MLFKAFVCFPILKANKKIMCNPAAPSSGQQWCVSSGATVEVIDWINEWMNGNLVYHLYLRNQKAKNSETQSIDSAWGVLLNETIAVFLGDWDREFWSFKGIYFRAFISGRPEARDDTFRSREVLTIKIWACSVFPFSSYEWICTGGAWPKWRTRFYFRFLNVKQLSIVTLQ